MLRKQKLAPTSKIVDAIYDKYILPERKYKRKVVKSSGITGSGKLSEHDLDMIRYLVMLGMNHRIVAENYGVSKATVSKIRNHDLFDKYFSPFEVKERFGFKVVDQFKLEEWVSQNIDEINSVKIKIEQESNIGS